VLPIQRMRSRRTVRMLVDEGAGAIKVGASGEARAAALHPWRHIRWRKCESAWMRRKRWNAPRGAGSSEGVHRKRTNQCPPGSPHATLRGYGKLALRRGYWGDCQLTNKPLPGARGLGHDGQEVADLAEAGPGQYSFLISKKEPRIVPASLDFCLANLNREASSTGTSIPSESLNPTARFLGASTVYITLIDRPLS
jgi:hypothetical protein